MRVTQRQSGTHLQRVQRQSPGREASVGVHARVQGAQRDGACVGPTCQRVLGGGLAEHTAGHGVVWPTLAEFSGKLGG